MKLLKNAELAVPIHSPSYDEYVFSNEDKQSIEFSIIYVTKNKFSEFFLYRFTNSTQILAIILTQGFI